jgi:ketosteroid isomerase-like protein
MKTRIAVYLWVIAISLTCLFVNSKFVDSDSADDDLARLKKLNARFIHNFVTNDTVSHSKIIHRDFILIPPSGSIVNRKNYLNGWAHGFDLKTYYYWDYRDERISLYGDVALVRSVTKYTKRQDGKEVPIMTRYTDTYVREKGEWKCVQAQLTSVTPENHPGDETIVKKYINGEIQ